MKRQRIGLNRIMLKRESFLLEYYLYFLFFFFFLFLGLLVLYMFADRLSLVISSLANKHYLKVADLAALDSDYYKAIEQYERIGRSSISNNLMKWSVKDYFLKAGICHLATKV